MFAVFTPAAAGNRLASVAKRLGATVAAFAVLTAAALAQSPETPPQPPASQNDTGAPQQPNPGSSLAPTTGRNAPTTPSPQPSAADDPSAPAAEPQAQRPQGAPPATSSDSQPSAGEATSPTPEATTPSEPAATPAQSEAPSIQAPPEDDTMPVEGQAPRESVTDLSQPEETEAPTIPHDLSPWGMFMAADWVVKSVMIGLAIASLATWTVWLVKTLELAGARARASRIIKIIRNSRTLSDAVEASAGRGGPAAYMLRAAADEMHLSEAALDHADGDGVKERVGSSLSRIEAYAGRRIARGTGILATIGSVAPFVGLFGTVWGIMNSFIGISETQTTNLAVVAPGIAEALLATAIGLVAAIPAVVIYNAFARSVTGYRQLLADAAAGVERLVSRDLDFRKVPPGGRKPASMSLVAGE
jgi:biopolymer transport protein ExbB